MSDPIIIIGGGPRPNATIYSVSRVSADPTKDEPNIYEIRDGNEVLFQCRKLSYLQVLLPLVQSGD